MGRTMAAVCLATIGSVACGAPEPPATPSWDLDVYPILRGSCSHCHGSTAGSEIAPTTRYDICTSAPFNAAFTAEKLWILGTDTAGNPVVGGAASAAGAISIQTGPGAPDILRMPPPPASPLSEYEATVLDRWAMASAASCAKRGPNRKPVYEVKGAPALEMGKVVVTVQVSDPDGDQVYGYVKLGSAPLQAIRGAGRASYAFEGVQPGDALTVKLHDGYEAGP